MAMSTSSVQAAEATATATSPAQIGENEHNQLISSPHSCFFKLHPQTETSSSGNASANPPANHPPLSEICTNIPLQTTFEGVHSESHESSSTLHPQHERITSARYGGTKFRHGHAATSVQRGAGGIEKKKSLSPVLRWFPRKKTESFLERKIRMLQEKEGGRIVSLDETLGAGGVHLCRVEREKLAARAAALKAMDARKQALIEASWCRIIKLAGVPCKLAILKLQEAERKASAATAEAAKLGVILHTGPPPPPADSELMPAVTASFDSAFEVDKDVANAIKEVLQQLDHPSADADEDNDHISISDLLQSHKSDVSDVSHKHQEAIDVDHQVEDAQGEELQNERIGNSSEELNCTTIDEGEEGKRPPIQSIASMMLERIVNLSAEHRASLARIVATCGLSALLKDQSLLEQEESMDGAPSSIDNVIHNTREDVPACDLGSILVKHVSKLQREIEASKSRTQSLPEPELIFKKKQQKEMPLESLDQILVKHVSKLEKEKLAAVQEASEQESLKEMKSDIVSAEHEGGFVSMDGLCDRNLFVKRKQMETPIESLDQILIKHVSKLEKEKIEAAALKASQRASKEDMKLDNIVEQTESSVRMGRNLLDTDVCVKRSQQETSIKSLDQILVKHISRLEKEKLAAQQASKQISRKDMNSDTAADEHDEMDFYVRRKQKEIPVEALDQILVKHVSKLEKEKLAATLESSKQALIKSMELDIVADGHSESSERPEKILARHLSYMKRQEQKETTSESLDQITVQQVLKEGEGFERTGNGSLSDGTGSSEMWELERRPHSKIASTSTTTSLEEPETQRCHTASYGSTRHHHDGAIPESVSDLGSILVKHISRLEREDTMKQMMMPSELKENSLKGSQRLHHEEPVPDLGSILLKHVSRLEKDKAKQAEMEKQAMSIGLEISRGEDLLGNRCEETAISKKETETYQPSAKVQGRKQSELGIVDHFSRRKLVREKQMEDVWGGLSLGNAMKRHVSKLELEQAAWRKAEEEARQRPNMQ